MFNLGRESRGRRSKGTAPRSASQAAKLSALATEADSKKNSKQVQNNGVLRQLVGLALAVTVMFLSHILLLSHLIHSVEQSKLRTVFADELRQATAPTGEVDFNNVLLAQGAPVAIIQIPKLGINEVVVEGTDGKSLMSGVGHRRDTVLPGQQGTSVLMGRAAAFGGPFGQIQKLDIGTKFYVITAQGKHTFKSLGMRQAGDFAPPLIKLGESRLILSTATGAPYQPAGMVYLDAELISKVQPAGAIASTIANVPKEDREFGFDTRNTLSLIFALQLLVGVEIACVFCLRRFGARGTYLVFTPLLLLSSILVMDQFTLFLPNLL